MPHLYCFGYGYCAQTLAATLAPQNWKISHSTRADFHALTLPADVTHILISIPPQNGQDLVLQHHIQALQALPNLVWVGHLSSTSVYGDTQGAWIDETAPLHSKNPIGKARIAAEQGWQASNLPVHLFRLSGIYGPGRNVITRLKNGTTQHIIKPGHVFNRIHVADISAALTASMLSPAPGCVYHLADDLPASHNDVITYGCTILGITPPPAIHWQDAPTNRFYAECRRLDNHKLKRDLLPILYYPTYKEGLKNGL